MTFAIRLRRAAALLAAALTMAPLAASAAAPKRITTASAVRLRSAPNTSAPVVATLALGVVLDELGRSDAPQKVDGREDYWYKVAAPGGRQGWVFGGLTRAADPSRLDGVHLEIGRERLENTVEELSFPDWVDAVDFLGRAARAASSREARGELELMRLAALGNALAAVPFEERDAAPYERWRDSLGDAVVYSEPAGLWLVAADEFWGLRDRYADTALGERIAWDAANVTLPGECEGDLGCHLAAYNLSAGRYLTLYPSGAHADEALGQLVEMLGQVAGGGYELPAEPQYRSELRGELAETRKVVSGASGANRAEALRLLDALDARLR
jgi:hypothetical protein